MQGINGEDVEGKVFEEGTVLVERVQCLRRSIYFCW